MQGKTQEAVQEGKFDKLTVGFIADLLYFKGILNYEEIDAIFDARTPQDLQAIIDKVMRSEFSAYKRGEHYEQSRTGE